MSTTVALGNGDTGLPDGTVIADEVVAGEHFQKVKLIDPTVGSAAPIGVAANPVRTAPVGSTSVDDGGGSLTVDGAVNVGNFPATQPVSGTVAVNNFPATQPVSGTVAVNNFPATQPVSGTFFQATQPVSAAALPLPAGASTEATLALIKAKTDNLDVALSTRTKPADTQAVSAAALPLPTGASTEATQLLVKAKTDNLDVALSTRLKPADTLAGVTTVAAVTAITNALPAGSNTLGKVDQGAANATPWNENLAQVGGTAISAKALPTGGSGQTAIPVYANAIQLLTYTFGARAIVTGALTANTAKAILSLEVAAANAKTVKIRRILISGIQTTSLAGLLDIQVNRGSAASSAGTAVTAGVRVTGDAAPSTVVKTLPTIVAATVLDQLPFGAAASAAVSAQGAVVLYDWQEGGETKPWTLKPGVIDSLVLEAISTAAQNWTLTIHVTLTEE